MEMGSCGVTDAALSSLSPLMAAGLEKVEAELGVGAFSTGAFDAEEEEAVIMPYRMA